MPPDQSSRQKVLARDSHECLQTSKYDKGPDSMAYSLSARSQWLESSTEQDLKGRGHPMPVLLAGTKLSSSNQHLGNQFALNASEYSYLKQMIEHLGGLRKTCIG